MTEAAKSRGISVSSARHMIGRVLLVICLCMLLPGSGMRVSAANMIEKAKETKVPKGELVRRSKGLRYRLKKNGHAVRDQWLYIKGEVYYFNSEGYAQTGFFKYRKKHYYADAEGKVQYGKWVSRKGKLYYLKKNGQRCEDVRKKVIRGKKYTFNEKGVLTSSKPPVYPGSAYLFVGDSRTVGMQMSVTVTGNVAFIGKVSQGYSYLAGVTDSAVRSRLRSNPYLTVIYAFGVNDPGNIGSYIAYYKRMIADYPNARFFFMSVNPVAYGRYVNNSMIASFNRSLLGAVGALRYVDSYNYLMGTGFSTRDGIHYTVPTYAKIYSYVMSKVRP